MKKKDSWRRPALDRARPKRQWDPSRRTRATGERKETSEPRDGAAKGASLGYKVSDAQFNEGKSHAQQFDIPGPGPGLPGLGALGGLSSDSFLSLSERLMRDAMLWFEFFARSTGSVGALRPAQTAPQPNTMSGGGVVVEVSSVLPIEVTFSPHEGAESRPLAVHDLRATDPDFPGITGAQVACIDGHWKIAISVGPKQPVGLYTGIVFDREDGAIRGTLALNVKSR
jgi:hypothetical protein